MARNWTLADVQAFDTWIRHVASAQVVKALELRAGYEIHILAPEGTDTQGLVEKYDKEFVNGTRN